MTTHHWFMTYLHAKRSCDLNLLPFCSIIKHDRRWQGIWCTVHHVQSRRIRSVNSAVRVTSSDLWTQSLKLQWQVCVAIKKAVWRLVLWETVGGSSHLVQTARSWIGYSAHLRSVCTVCTNPSLRVNEPITLITIVCVRCWGLYGICFTS